MKLNNPWNIAVNFDFEVYGMDAFTTTKGVIFFESDRKNEPLEIVTPPRVHFFTFGLGIEWQSPSNEDFVKSAITASLN